MKIKLSAGSLSIKDTARSSAVAEETFSKLVASVLKLVANLLRVEVLPSEQGGAVDDVGGGRAVRAGLEPVGLLGGWRGVLQGGLELTALVGAGASAPLVVSPGLRPPVPGGESDADVGLSVLRDEDWSKGGLFLSAGKQSRAGVRSLPEGASEVCLQEPKWGLLCFLSCDCCY